MTSALSETVSENRRRGRPRAFDAATFAQLRAEMRRDTPDISDRTVQNRLYQFRAQALLDSHDWARWLIDPEGIMQGKRGAYRQTILQELGRIKDDDDLLWVAERVCLEKPTAHEAVKTIRAMRRGEKPQGEAFDLADQIIAVINAYIRHHAGVDRDLLLRAVQDVDQAVRSIPIHRPTDPLRPANDEPEEEPPAP